MARATEVDGLLAWFAGARTLRYDQIEVPPLPGVSDAINEARERGGRAVGAPADRGLDVEVIPMLVLHGRSKGALETPELRRGETRVVSAGEAKDWLPRMQRAASPGPLDERVRDAVVEMAEESREG